MSQDRQTKLDSTISSVTPDRLEATRAEVDVARMKLDEHDSKSIIIEAGDLISDRPPPLVDAAAEAEARLEKLNLIQDVQLILVDKYRRGSHLMFGALFLLVAGFGGIISLYIKNRDLYDRMGEMQDDQRTVVNNLRIIADSQSKIEKSTDKTQEALVETQEKLQAAVEASPKIEVDANGKTKLLVPVKSASPKAPKPKPAPVPTQISVEPKH